MGKIFIKEENIMKIIINEIGKIDSKLKGSSESKTHIHFDIDNNNHLLNRNETKRLL